MILLDSDPFLYDRNPVKQTFNDPSNFTFRLNPDIVFEIIAGQGKVLLIN